MECGIIGLPGVGKTCLFEALTGSLPHGFAPGRANIGVAHVPDPRLDQLATWVEARKITRATITFVDIPGIDPGHGAARTAPLFAHVRQVDALCHVVRCFPDGTGPADPLRDIRKIEDEMLLADLAIVEPALERIRRALRAPDAETKARGDVLAKLLPVLTEGSPAREITGWTPQQQVIMRGLGLMTAKRIVYVANIAEDDLGGTSAAARAVRDHAEKSLMASLALCAKLEAELSRLDEADRAEMLTAMGLKEPAIGALARVVCRLLGLAVFYTAGEKEARAWTVAESATAPEAAGVIHTDMQRGFIRAECYHYDDIRELGSEKAVKAAGRMRTEGKGYHIRDGDVVRVLFNV
jgi:GTP-binding protein YchF